LQTRLDSDKRPIRITTPSEIPLNRNGKSDRSALAHLADLLLRGPQETQVC